jgi:hypothetical protein
MRNFRLLWLIAAVLLVADCALLTRTYRPPRAPQAEAAKVKFPWGAPRQRIVLTGAWLRAVTMALDDFLPAEEAERRPESELDECLSRRENYLAYAWVWSPRGANDAGSEAGDGGLPDVDGGSSFEAGSGLEGDAGCCGAGDEEPFEQPGMPRAPALIYVTVGLIPGHCELDGSPLMDVAAVYAIDTVNWRILAVHH